MVDNKRFKKSFWIFWGLLLLLIGYSLGHWSLLNSLYPQGDNLSYIKGALEIVEVQKESFWELMHVYLSRHSATTLLLVIGKIINIIDLFQLSQVIAIAFSLGLATYLYLLLNHYVQDYIAALIAGVVLTLPFSLAIGHYTNDIIPFIFFLTGAVFHFERSHLMENRKHTIFFVIYLSLLLLHRPLIFGMYCLGPSVFLLLTEKNTGVRVNILASMVILSSIFILTLISYYFRNWIVLYLLPFVIILVMVSILFYKRHRPDFAMSYLVTFLIGIILASLWFLPQSHDFYRDIFHQALPDNEGRKSDFFKLVWYSFGLLLPTYLFVLSVNLYRYKSVRKKQILMTLLFVGPLLILLIFSYHEIRHLISSLLIGFALSVTFFVAKSKETIARFICLVLGLIIIMNLILSWSLSNNKKLSRSFVSLYHFPNILFNKYSAYKKSPIDDISAELQKLRGKNEIRVAYNHFSYSVYPKSISYNWEDKFFLREHMGHISPLSAIEFARNSVGIDYKIFYNPHEMDPSVDYILIQSAYPYSKSNYIPFDVNELKRELLGKFKRIRQIKYEDYYGQSLLLDLFVKDR